VGREGSQVGQRESVQQEKAACVVGMGFWVLLGMKEGQAEFLFIAHITFGEGLKVTASLQHISFLLHAERLQSGVQGRGEKEIAVHAGQHWGRVAPWR
jgi:hypothetical protein